MRRLSKWLVLSWLAVTAVGWAQEPTAVADSAVSDSIARPAPVTDLTARDRDNDHGHAIKLQWTLSADDGKGANSVLSYEIFRWEPYLLDTLRSVFQEIDRWHNLLVLSEEGSETRFIREVNARGDTVGFKLTDEQLEHRIDSLNLLGKRLEDELPAAFANYPNNGEWRQAGKTVAGTSTFVDEGTLNPSEKKYFPDDVDLHYKVEAVTADSDVRSEAVVTGPVQATDQWYNDKRTVVLIAVIIFTFLTLLFLNLARKGTDLYVRPLAGIEAVDEAIGRATEMGRPILYVLGLGSASDIATIASFTILGRVAKKVAEYQTDLLVPCYDPIVMSVAQEVVKSAFLDAGHPDAYNQDMVYFVTQSQFAYVAAVNGTMLRERPATNLYMGKFYAESLLLAETGALAGSIQMAGTDEIPQIPFFIVACDYTLIGEELFAASAYLGREPILLGSLKAQDYAKAIVIILVIIGLIGVNIGVHSDSLSWMNKLHEWIQAVE
ncbi:MAG: hypothetical protein D6800_13580 [Candidatus Zixiibacteriota bacterium]|nr:MAG: hypothetical protein D6800_13580 [candidate division Zixibacteria bacterium]